MADKIDTAAATPHLWRHVALEPGGAEFLDADPLNLNRLKLVTPVVEWDAAAAF